MTPYRSIRQTLPAAVLLASALLAATVLGAEPKRADPKEFVNSIGMKLMRIPAGSFLMGAAMDEADHGDDEIPAHPDRRRGADSD